MAVPTLIIFLNDLLTFEKVLRNHLQMESQDNFQSFGDLRLNDMAVPSFVNILEDSQTYYLLEKYLAPIHKKNHMINHFQCLGL